MPTSDMCSTMAPGLQAFATASTRRHSSWLGQDRHLELGTRNWKIEFRVRGFIPQLPVSEVFSGQRSRPEPIMMRVRDTQATRSLEVSGWQIDTV